MKITKQQLKQIIKEEIEEAKGIPGSEYHDTASKIGRPVSPWSDEKPEKTQGPALPAEMQIVADFVNKKIPAWLRHAEEMEKSIEDRDNYMVKGSPGITKLLQPIQDFQYHIRNLQKNLEQDKPIRRHAMGIPFSNDYVEVPSEEEERTILYAYRELAAAFAEAAGYVETRNYAGSTEKQKRLNKQPNYTEVAKDVRSVLMRLVHGREQSTWRDETASGLASRPFRVGENLKKIIHEELEAVLSDGYGET